MLVGNRVGIGLTRSAINPSYLDKGARTQHPNGAADGSLSLIR